MHDLTNLIEEIRTALAHSELVPPERLEVYARQYAEACTKLNERIKLCFPYLRTGNVFEVVRLVETQPNLLDTFNLLNFEGRKEWIAEVCDPLGLEIPPPLAVEILQELDKVYSQAGSLETKLKWHRLFALNGSPIRDRLAVLRAIAKADPMNLHWQTDQETFEKVRIKELNREITEALAKNDLPRIRELYQELTVPEWRNVPPKEYRQKLAVPLLRDQAHQLIRHHDESIKNRDKRYYTAPHYSNAAAIYQAMLQMLSENQMAMPAIEDQMSLETAVQWLQETALEQHSLAQFQQYREQFQWEVARFKEALVNNFPLPTLHDLYFSLCHAANHAKMEIPEELELRYRNRVDYTERATSFLGSLYWFVFGMIVLVILMLGGLFVCKAAEPSLPNPPRASPKPEAENTLAALAPL